MSHTDGTPGPQPRARSTPRSLAGLAETFGLEASTVWSDPLHAKARPLPCWRTSDEALLLDRSRAGDVASMQALLRRHHARILKMVRRLCPDPEDAEEVLQDTLVAITRNIRRFRGDASLLTWVYTVARSQAARRRRKARSRASESLTSSRLLANSLLDESWLPDDAVARVELHRALHAGLRTLSELDRRVLWLRDGQGLTSPEVAAATGLTVPAVKTRLHRARKAMRRYLRPLLPAILQGI